MILWLNKIKDYLLLAGAGIITALLLYISTLKNRSLKKEIEQKDKLFKASEDANEAVKKGLEEEAKPIKRGYFDELDRR